MVIRRTLLASVGTLGTPLTAKSRWVSRVLTSRDVRTLETHRNLTVSVSLQLLPLGFVTKR